MRILVSLGLAMASAAAVAQTPAPPVPPVPSVPPPAAASAAAPAAGTTDRSEPRVERAVIDDGQTRIEELRVRGRLQRVIVTPRGGQPYEIVVGDGGRAAGEGAAGPRGTAGQRVWQVLSF
jgi:hypothetical protein